MEPSSGEEKPKGSPISRRQFLRVAALTAVGVGSAVVEKQYGVLRGVAGRFANVLRSKESLSPVPFEVGFTTHAMDWTTKEGKPDVPRFKTHVDVLALTNQQWVRFDIRPWYIVKAGTTTTIEWNEEGLQAYDEAIGYAREKGLKLFMNISTPDFAREYKGEDYQKAMELFAGDVAKRFSPKGQELSRYGEDHYDIYQLFNEPDLHDFRTYSVSHQMGEDYLRELSTVVRAMDGAIKRNNPHAKTTLNMAHWAGAPWGGPEEFKKRAARFCDTVAQPVDIISLDPYPYKSEEEIKSLPEYVSFIKKRYNKEVIIAEIGFPGGREYSEEDQVRYLRRYLNALKGGNDLPLATFIYQLAEDQSTEANDTAMGVLHADGKLKASFTPLIQSMQYRKRK